MTTSGGVIQPPRQQVINWGVFDGYHDIEFSRTGTLLTGSSGAGKSSLLDALSVAFLSQRRRNFNASSDKSSGHAPQSSQRSVDKYIRGMVGDVQNPGERARKKFLRPNGAAWSAIAVTYSGSHGLVITGLVLKWLQAGQESMRLASTPSSTPISRSKTPVTRGRSAASRNRSSKRRAGSVAAKTKGGISTPSTARLA
jgi:uncharacterized protein YPO0396